MPCSEGGWAEVGTAEAIAMSRKPAPPNWLRWRRSRPPSVRRQSAVRRCRVALTEDALDDCLRPLLDARRWLLSLEALRVELGGWGWIFRA